MKRLKKWLPWSSKRPSPPSPLNDPEGSLPTPSTMTPSAVEQRGNPQFEQSRDTIEVPKRARDPPPATNTSFSAPTASSHHAQQNFHQPGEFQIFCAEVSSALKANLLQSDLTPAHFEEGVNRIQSTPLPDDQPFSPVDATSSPAPALAAAELSIPSPVSQPQDATSPPCKFPASLSPLTCLRDPELRRRGSFHWPSIFPRSLVF